MEWNGYLLASRRTVPLSSRKAPHVAFCSTVCSTRDVSRTRRRVRPEAVGSARTAATADRAGHQRWPIAARGHAPEIRSAVLQDARVHAEQHAVLDARHLDDESVAP